MLKNRNDTGRYFVLTTSNKYTYSIHCSESVFCDSGLSESTMMICRICHESESREELVSLCKCAGTMGLLHRSCVEKWLSSVNSNQCEICNFRYITSKKKRPFHEVGVG